ncbi:MAG: bifunctional DNA-formamidopyrimidine glycosylase/DNA-(apurinic or apyrimidinic site) lyase [Chloroflexi bacterium]|nr:bifunctional DNA-formamidopyrimidine glycosylase/DNA-(apurinic or apyrimidinic site) lyase [Chloroflexota bacterium]
MPELPEVEHIRRGLDRFLPGRCIEGVNIPWPGILATHTPSDFAAAVRGLAFGPVARRGKYLIICLPPHTLTIHLRMTGRLYAADEPDPGWEDHPHTRAVFQLDGGARLYMRDLRKFGRIYLSSSASSLVDRLGPEPLSDTFTLERFAEMLSSHHRQIKPLLLDQHTVAGLGNIYTDESLWKAGLHPLRRADSLTAEEVAALYTALRAILAEAVTHGGTTLRDYRGVDDVAGSHQRALAVYGRAGHACPRCCTPVVRIVVGQRGTHICPTCQREHEPREDDCG